MSINLGNDEILTVASIGPVTLAQSDLGQLTIVSGSVLESALVSGVEELTISGITTTISDLQVSLMTEEEFLASEQ
jgi:hypothetical protein